LILIPVWLPQWINRTERFVRILSTTNDCVVFIVRNADYARLLEQANNSG
jgi:hypothetical protein